MTPAAMASAVPMRWSSSPGRAPAPNATAAKRDGAGPRPQLVIRASLDTLAGTRGAPAGELEGGGTVPAETVQRYACDSAISRITGQGELEHELNHASRTFAGVDPAGARGA